jgi:Fic family protein
MDELKREANPFNKLLRVMEELQQEQVRTTNVLCSLCDTEEAALALKEQQLKTIHLQHEEWKRAKHKDERVSKVVVAIGLLGIALAGLALYHDVIKIDPVMIQHVSDYVDTLL